MVKFAESEVEDAALAWLAGLGYAVVYGPDIDPEGLAPERGGCDEVLLAGRLRKALARLNPHLPAETLEDVLRKVRQTETPSLVEENRCLHRYLVEGVPVEVAREDGSVGGDVARLIDFDDIEANDWLAVNQFTVIEHEHNRRPDVVLFVNGLPLAVIELKNPGDENATLEGAFNQLQTYKDQIPSLFRTNAALVTSDGLHARLGSLTASLERFMPWRTVDGYHQFHAVRHAVERTIAATSPGGDPGTACDSVRAADSPRPHRPSVSAADAAVTGAPPMPALAVTSERRAIAMNCIAFTICPCVAVTCVRCPFARRNMCGRAGAPRERSRPRCVMCDECRRRLASGHASYYLCRTDDNAARAQVLRPGRFAQSPRWLQTLAAPALRAGHGVQGNFAKFDPRRGLGSHTIRS